MDYFKTYKKGVIWNVKKGQTHFDDIEMAGFMSAFIVSYGADENGKAVFSRYCVFPTFRTRPNDTQPLCEKNMLKTVFREYRQTEKNKRKRQNLFSLTEF